MDAPGSLTTQRKWCFKPVRIHFPHPRPFPFFETNARRNAPGSRNNSNLKRQQQITLCLLWSGVVSSVQCYLPPFVQTVHFFRPSPEADLNMIFRKAPSLVSQPLRACEWYFYVYLGLANPALLEIDRWFHPLTLERPAFFLANHVVGTTLVYEY